MRELTCVVADDARIYRELAEGVLSRFGVKIVAAVEDGSPALDAIRKHQPDFCVLDIVMNGMTGLEVAKAIKSEGLRTKVILVTSMGQDGAAHQEGNNADAVLIKPYMPEMLIEKVVSVLDGLNS